MLEPCTETRKENTWDKCNHRAHTSFTTRIDACLCLSMSAPLCALRVECHTLKRHNEPRFRWSFGEDVKGAAARRPC